MFVINYNSKILKILNTHKRVSVDYLDAKLSAEYDGPRMATDEDGKVHPWMVEMTLIKNKINNKNNWKAEIIVFEKELDRDLYILHRNEKYIQQLNQLN